MVPVTVLAIALLAFANYRIGGKAAFYPPVIFCFVWIAALMLCWISGDFFYPLSAETLAIYLCGCVAFSIGSWLVLLLPRRTAMQPDEISKTSNHILTVLVALVVIAAPFCYRWLMDFASGPGEGGYLRAVYTILSQDANQRDSRVSLVLNIVSFSNVVALCAFFERDRGKKRAVIAVVAAFVLNVMTGGRTGFTTLILALVCIDWLKTRRMRWKMIVAAFIVFLVASSAVAIYVQKGDARADASLVENAKPVAELFVYYGAGALVAFDQFVRDPNVVPVNWSIDRFFLQTLNKFGAHFDVPEVNAAFVTIGPTTPPQNIYTLYFAYWDLGKPGMIVLVVAIGFVITWFYQRAIAGEATASMLYSVLFAGVFLSTLFEPFFLNLNALSKLYVICWLLYVLPSRFQKFSQVMKHAVRANLAATKL
jgi:oligosaccharide repeat unit polymerase